MSCTALTENQVSPNIDEWPNVTVNGDANIFDYNGKLYCVIWHTVMNSPGGVVGHICRSLDNGVTWVQIQDFEHVNGFFDSISPCVRIYGTVLYIMCTDHTRQAVDNHVVGGLTNHNFAFKFVTFDLATEVLVDPFLLGPNDFWVDAQYLGLDFIDFVFRGNDIVILTKQQVYGICVDMGGNPTTITTQLWLYTRVAGVWSSTDITATILGVNGTEGYQEYDIIFDCMQIGPSGIVNVFYHQVTEYDTAKPLCILDPAGDTTNTNLRTFQIKTDNTIANLQVIENICTHKNALDFVSTQITSNLFWDASSGSFIMTYMGRTPNNFGDLKFLSFSDVLNPAITKSTVATGVFGKSLSSDVLGFMRITNQSNIYVIHYTDPFALNGSSNVGKIWRVSANSIAALITTAPTLIWTHVGVGNNQQPVVPQQFVVVAGTNALCSDAIGFGATNLNGVGNPPGRFFFLKVGMSPPLPGPIPGPVTNPTGCPDVI